MRAYFDTAYIAKCYVVEPDSEAVRTFADSLSSMSSVGLCIPELAAVFHRHVREKRITQNAATKLHARFVEDVERGVWTLLPMSQDFLRRVAAKLIGLPGKTAMRAADATHLLCASENGFDAIWTNDRHMLAAAPSFGLLPKSM